MTQTYEMYLKHVLEKSVKAKRGPSVVTPEVPLRKPRRRLPSLLLRIPCKGVSFFTSAAPSAQAEVVESREARLPRYDWLLTPVTLQVRRCSGRAIRPPTTRRPLVPG
jgi:hypothetical protein